MKQYSKLMSAVALGIISSSLVITSQTVVAQERQFDSFADWCENRASLSSQAQHTVKVLLEKAETSDCLIADWELSFRSSQLNLEGEYIVDISPLSSLTNLTLLKLNDNQI
ncbi:MAG: leucine-rich repeat domain-containing protein, partial [Oscillatoria sp. PMC 1076.18]|nr:leucine-rich repeat domain-containing protein [Oscillatoria sp. PMC 1076.18]